MTSSRAKQPQTAGTPLNRTPYAGPASACLPAALDAAGDTAHLTSIWHDPDSCTPAEVDIVTFLWGVTLTEEGLEALRSGRFRPGALTLSYPPSTKPGEPKRILTNDKKRSLAFKSLVARALFADSRRTDGGRPPAAPVDDHVEQRYHLVPTADEVAALPLPAGVELFAIEIVLAKDLAAIPQTFRPGIAYLHFRIRRDADGSSGTAVSFIRTHARLRGEIPPAGNGVDTAEPGREGFALQLSTALPCIRGFLFAMLESTETAHIGEAPLFDDPETVRRFLGAGAVQRPYTIAAAVLDESFRNIDPADAPMETVRAARPLLTGDSVEESNATEDTLREEARKDLLSLSKDWSCLIGSDGAVFVFHPPRADAEPGTLPWMTLGRVFAHTIYADIFAFVLLGARLAEQVNTTLTGLFWDVGDTVDHSRIFRLRRTVLALGVIYGAQRISASDQQHRLATALRSKHGMMAQLDRMKTMVEDLSSVTTALASIESKHREKLKSRLLGIITFGLAPAGLADRLVPLVAGDGAGAGTHLAWWLVVSVAIGLGLWVILGIMGRIWPVDGDLEAHSVTRDNREFLGRDPEPATAPAPETPRRQPRPHQRR